LLFQGLDVAHLGLIKLILDDFSRFLFALVHLLKALLHFPVVVLHLELVILDPSFLDLLIDLLFSLFKVNLSIAFLKHVGEEHLCVKSLDLILGIMKLLIGCLNGLKSFLLVVGLFLGIDTSAFELFLLKFLVAVLYPLVSHVLNGVGPVLHAST
jgi:hypothetical protein